jgi:hypothetical protein
MKRRDLIISGTADSALSQRRIRLLMQFDSKSTLVFFNLPNQTHHESETSHRLIDRAMNASPERLKIATHKSTNSSLDAIKNHATHCNLRQMWGIR